MSVMTLSYIYLKSSQANIKNTNSKTSKGKPSIDASFVTLYGTCTSYDEMIKSLKSICSAISNENGKVLNYCYFFNMSSYFMLNMHNFKCKL